MKRQRGKNRGQDLVEFAILIPILIMSLLMIVDLGRVTYAYSVIFNAAREGTRYASVHFDNAATRSAETTTYIHDRIPGLDPGLLSVVFNWVNNPTFGEPDRVTIVLSYPFDPITPFIAGILGADPFIIGTQATMNLEH